MEIVNKTREGIIVAPGQTWLALDPRRENWRGVMRLVTVIEVKDGRATVIGEAGNKTKIRVKFMYAHYSGWRLVPTTALQAGLRAVRAVQGSVPTVRVVHGVSVAV